MHEDREVRLRANYALGDWTTQTDAVLVAVLNPAEFHEAIPGASSTPCRTGGRGLSAPFYMAPPLSTQPLPGFFFLSHGQKESLGHDCSSKWLLPVPQGLLCPLHTPEWGPPGVSQLQ